VFADGETGAPAEELGELEPVNRATPPPASRPITRTIATTIATVRFVLLVAAGDFSPSK
jgi:hypothetical protein